MTKINSPIADEAKNLIKGGRNYIEYAWDNIHDDLLEGYYNRVNELYDGYNPEEYGFKLMTEEDRNHLKEIQWKDPMVEDLLNNYDWKDHIKFMNKLKTEYPKAYHLLNREFLSWVKNWDEEDE